MMSPKWPQVYSEDNNIKWPSGFSCHYCALRRFSPTGKYYRVKFAISFKLNIHNIVWAPILVTGELVSRKWETIQLSVITYFV